MASPFDLLSEYELRNLPSHCVAAGRTDDLHLLLTTSSDGANAWFQTKDTRGMAAEYFADLLLGQKLAENEFLTHGSAEALGRLVLYTLTHSSLSQASSNLPVMLLDALIRTGIWSVEQATAYARNVSDPVRYPVAIASMVKHADKDHQRPLVDEALRAVENITIPVEDKFHEDTAPEDLRIGVILELLPLLPEQYTPELLRILNETNEWQVWEEASEFARAMPVRWLNSIVEWVTKMPRNDAARFITEVLKRTRDIHVQQIAYDVAVGNMTADESCDPTVYTGLLSLLPRRLRLRLYRTVLATEPGRLREGQLMTLAQRAHEFQPSELELFRKHARHLASAGTRLEVQAILQANSIGRRSVAGIPDFRWRPGAWRRLARDRAVSVLVTAAQFAGGKSRSRLLNHALKATVGIREKRGRIAALVKIAELCTGRQRRLLLDRALQAVGAIDDKSQRCGALGDIMPQLASRHVQECLSIYRTLDEYDRTLCNAGYDRGLVGIPCAASDLVKLANGADLDAFVDEIMRTRDANCRRVELSAALPKLFGARLKHVARECLAAARTIGDRSAAIRTSAFFALYGPRTAAVRNSAALPYLSDSVTDEGVEEVYQSPQPWLDALNNDEAKANLSECYLRYYFRDRGPLDLHSFGELIGNLTDARKKVIARLITRKVAALRGNERYYQALEGLLGLASVPAEFVEELLTHVGQTACNCARIFYESERLKYLAGSDRHRAATALIPMKVSKLCLNGQQAYPCRLPLADPLSASLRQELAILPVVGKRERRKLLRRLASKIDDSSLGDIPSLVARHFPIEAPASARQRLARRILRQIPKKNRAAFFPYGLVKHLPRKEAKSVALAAQKERKFEIDDFSEEWADERAVSRLIEAGLIKRALKVARWMDRENRSSEAIAQISPYCREATRAKLLHEALANLAGVRDESSRDDAALALAKAGHFISLDAKRKLIAAWLRQLGSLERAAALSELKHVSTLAMDVAGIDGIRALVSGVQTVSSWWI